MPSKPIDESTTDSPAQSGLEWGIEQLDIDGSALDTGRVVLRSATGVFPDGTAFRHPTRSVDPLVLVLPRGSTESAVFLVCHQDLPANSGATPAHRCLDLRLEPDLADAQALAVARVLRRSDNESWVLDGRFVPPTHRAHASPLLSQLLHEVSTLVELRCRDLAGYLSDRTSVAEITNFLMLLDLNRAHAELRHLQALPDLHPERLFLALSRLTAANSTYTGSHLAFDLPTYRHADPGPPFLDLMGRLTRQLSSLTRHSARTLPIQSRKYGIRVVLLDEAAKSGLAHFVLQVQAQLPADALRSRFPSQVKIGPIDHIRDLVNLQLPGIVLKAMGVVPRELPYSAGAAYFMLDDMGTDLWSRAVASGGFAIHVAGDFPELDMTLWHLQVQS